MRLVFIVEVVLVQQAPQTLFFYVAVSKSASGKEAASSLRTMMRAVKQQLATVDRIAQIVGCVILAALVGQGLERGCAICQIWSHVLQLLCGEPITLIAPLLTLQVLIEMHGSVHRF